MVTMGNINGPESSGVPGLSENMLWVMDMLRIKCCKYINYTFLICTICYISLFGFSLDYSHRTRLDLDGFGVRLKCRRKSLSDVIV